MFNLKAILLTATLIAGGITVASAQIEQGAVLKVNIPNSFVLKGKTFAAGNYTIERTPSSIDSPTLMILRGEDGSGVIFDTIQSSNTDTAGNTQIVFDNVNGTYYLSQISIKGTPRSSDVAMSRAQSRMIAANPAHKLVVTADNGF